MAESNGDLIVKSILSLLVGMLIAYMAAVSTHGKEIQVLRERVDNLSKQVEFRFALDAKQLDEALEHTRGGPKTGHSE